MTFYGGGVAEGRFGLPSLIAQAPALQTPWLGLYGDIDQGIPVADVEQLQAATAAAKVPTENVRYPDADHGFNCNDRPAVFNPWPPPTPGAEPWPGSSSISAPDRLAPEVQVANWFGSPQAIPTSPAP